VIAGGVLLAAWGGFERRILTVLLGLLATGAGLLGIGLMPPAAFWPAVALAFLTTTMAALVNGPIMAILQVTVAPEMQGRIFGLVGSVTSGIAPLGLLVAGPVADALGISFWYLAGGLSCVLMATALYFVPAVRKVEDHEADRAEPAVTLPSSAL
jgi:MFS transporter, DHA3 family, macrolide efflux protein